MPIAYEIGIRVRDTSTDEGPALHWAGFTREEAKTILHHGTEQEKFVHEYGWRGLRLLDEAYHGKREGAA